MLREIASGVKTQIGKKVHNRELMTDLALSAFFADGHILLTGPTGIGKTAWARELSYAFGLTFAYDWLMKEYPTDIKFSQIYMAKQLSQASPQIETMLLGSMCNTTHTCELPLPEPFFLIGTKDNDDILSNSLSDRFMISLTVPYPGLSAEKQILQLHNENSTPHISSLPVCNLEAILHAKEEVTNVRVEEPVYNYIISIIETTRRVGAVTTGASPRGSIALLKSAKAYAAIQGRDFVTTDDVQIMALPVLRHRIKLNPDAIKEGIHPDQIIEGILAGR